MRKRWSGWKLRIGRSLRGAGLLLVLCVSLDVLAQKEIRRSKFGNPYLFDQSNDSLLAYSQRLQDKYDLPVLLTDTGRFHLRYHSESQFLDIWTEDFQRFQGLLTQHVYRTEWNRKTKNRDFVQPFVNRVEIDSNIAHRLYMATLPIVDMPLEDSISGWRMFMDGHSEYFELSTKTTYTIKSYRNPDSQDDTLWQASAIQLVVDSIDSLLHLERRISSWVNTLKPGIYSSDGYHFRRVYTPEQAAIHEKMRPQLEYLRSMMPQIKDFLVDTLSHIFQAKGLYDTNEFYWLQFSKSNRLVRIKLSQRHPYVSDWLKAIAFKPKIRSAFRRIRMDFLQMEYPYVLRMWIENGHVGVAL